MIFLDEIEYMKLYKKPFYLPIIEKDKRKGSSVFLLTPNIDQSFTVLENELLVNKNMFESYYIEKDVTYYINQEGYLIDNDLDILNEGTSAPHLFFLSEKNLNGKTLNPRVPDNYLTKNNYEDNTTKRVCFSTSIDKALIALSQNVKGKEFYVHVPKPNTKINVVKPTVEQVPDCKITEERWVLNSVELQAVSKIVVTDNGDNEFEYTYGDNQKATLYDWKWKLLGAVNGTVCYLEQITQDYQLNENALRRHTSDGDTMIVFGDNLDEEVVNENKIYNPMLHKILYTERLKNNKEVFEIYDQVKTVIPYIKRTYLDIAKYNKLNLFVDLSYYNRAFFKNNMYKLDKAVELYSEFVNRLINDKRIGKAGYTKKTVIVPVLGWEGEDIFDYKEQINPISMILRLLQLKDNTMKEWEDIDFIFLSTNSYIKVDLSKLEKKDTKSLAILLDKLYDKEPVIDDGNESKKAIVANIVDKIETSQKIKINNLTGDGGEIDKDELVKKIEKAAATSTNTDQAMEEINDDDKIKEIITQLASEENNKVDINNARLSRMTKLNDEFQKKQIHGKTVKQLLDEGDVNKELPVTSLQLDTVNDEWKNLQYMNFEKSYNIDEDIIAIIESFSRKTVPVAVRDIKVEDTSTSEDLKETYVVQMEDANGDRFTIKFDVPKFKDHKFMMLRGNDKTINGQLVLLPISKTDEDTVQIVSNYKKIFIERFGSTAGKSFVITDRILKTLNKCDTTKFTIGDNSRICSKYELPMDYIDLASSYTTIENKVYRVYLNQDEIREKYKIDEKKGIPYAVNKSTKEVLYFNEGVFSANLLQLLSEDTNFMEIYENTSISSRYTYSSAKILNRKIPLIVIMSYNEGLVQAMKKGNIRYELTEKRAKYDKNTKDMIKFKDGYILYDLDYNSSLLMNGLKKCNTEDYSIGDINNKSMYLDFLDIFGGRILADGLDNFYDLMIDPITEEVLEYYKLPTDYVELLAYANLLLSDNKYIKHTDMRSNRYRSNEIIAGYVYQSLSEAYEDYRLQLKRRKKGAMSMKQTIVLDKVLLDPTCSDASTLNPLTDIESANSVSFKGLAGMNSDRGYSLDKRTFDDSMLNVLGLSTGFAGNVGITRQATMDMNIEGKRGYIKITKDTNDLNITKTFTATEALTPFGTTRDDPFRSAMTFIQTSKHGMRIKKGDPLLISNGSDQALPYMTSNSFAYKAKFDGKVIEKTDDYIIVEYENGTNDYIDLRDIVKKNSNGGFFISVKLDSDLKVGAKVKQNDIVAYDKLSYSDKIGHTDNLAYNLGALTKIAILNTDEGFEDSAIISDWLSDAMASDVVLKKEVILPKNTNIYNMVKKGQAIQEGDPLMIFQNAFEEEDVNILLKNLVDDEEAISDLGRIPIKSKITGEVKDIKIYRTVEKEELSDSLKKKVNEIEKPISDLRKVMKKYDIDSANRLEADYKLESTGKLKNVEDGVMIEFYLKYEDKMSVGDKLIYFSALKGVVKDIFPKDKEPYTNFRPNEKIHSLLSQGSVVGRMVCSIILNLSINKVLVELDRKVKDIAGIPWKNLDEE